MLCIAVHVNDIKYVFIFRVITVDNVLLYLTIHRLYD